MKPLLTASLLLLGTACSLSPPNGADLNEAQSEQFLNQRRYGELIARLEEQSSRGPLSEKQRKNLGEAYLGRSGFELLAFADRVVSPIPAAQASGFVGQIFPSCPLNTRFDIARDAGTCLIRRLFALAPQTQSGDFLRGRQILRDLYPEPENTPVSTNTFLGTLDVLTAFSLAREAIDALITTPVAQLAEPTQLRAVHLLLKDFRENSRRALARAQFSEEQISQALTRMKHDTVFRLTERGLDFVTDTAFPYLHDFSLLVEKLEASENPLGSVQRARLEKLLEEAQKSLREMTDGRSLDPPTVEG